MHQCHPPTSSRLSHDNILQVTIYHVSSSLWLCCYAPKSQHTCLASVCYPTNKYVRWFWCVPSGEQSRQEGGRLDRHCCMRLVRAPRTTLTPERSHSSPIPPALPQHSVALVSAHAAAACERRRDGRWSASRTRSHNPSLLTSPRYFALPSLARRLPQRRNVAPSPASPAPFSIARYSTARPPSVATSSSHS